MQTTAKISRAEVALSSESRSLVWGVVSTTIDGATVQENQSLRSGSLYVQGSKVYLEPQYEGHAPTKVSESYARYRQNRLVTVGVQQSTAASKLYEISAYTGRVTAEEEGVYDATAVLRLINENDYEFKAAGYDAEYGVRVTLTNGSTASVTKTWYIVGGNQLAHPRRRHSRRQRSRVRIFRIRQLGLRQRYDLRHSQAPPRRPIGD